MPTLEEVQSSVYSAIDEFNQLQPAEHQLDKTPETVLLGAGSKIDSLGLVGLLVTIEQQVNSDFGSTITLASEKAFSLRNSPFANVRTLNDYIGTLLEEARG